MRWLYKLPLRIRSLFKRARVEHELSDELRFHLEKLIEEKVRKGMTPDEARYAALRELGGVEQIKEECRDMRRVNYIQNFMQDLRYGLRQLSRNPGFTAVAAITLALGIGANSLIFSVVNAAILHPLPFRDANRLVTLWATSPTIGFSGPGALSDPDYKEWRMQNHVFSEIAAYRGQPSNLTGGGEPMRLTGVAISSSLLRLLDVSPALGRAFAPEEETAGHNRVALLSDRLWRSRFGADRPAVGRSIKLDGEFYTVIGVMPAGFDFPNDADVWIPLTLANDAHNASLQIVARLKPHVTIESARRDVALIDKRFKEQRAPHPAGGWEWHIALVPLSQAVASDVRTPLLVLFGAVGLVLLIACANVANLFLARATTRQREIGIRKALGAGRARVIRQMLTESVMMAVLGGALGLLLAALGQSVVAKAASLLPRSMASSSAAAHIASTGIDFWVLGFTLAVSVLTAVLFGLTPAVRASRGELSDSLKEGGRGVAVGRSYLRDGIVVAEVALALILLVGAGLLIRSFLGLMSVDPGFSPQNALTMNISLPESRYAGARPMIAFEQQALDRLAALPGVKSAGGVFGLPLGNGAIAGDFTVEGQETPPPGTQAFIAAKKVIGGEYFKAIGIPLLKGRYFDEHDSEAGPHVVIVSQDLARHFWPQGDAIGKRLKPGFSNDAWCTVVGIVGETKQYALDETSSPSMYLPYAQAPVPFLMQDITFVLRTRSDPLSLVAPARRAVQAVDPDLPVFDVATMEQLVYKSASGPRFNTALLGIFAALALILATVGVYGVMSYTVLQRTHEIGVRMALGADAGDIIRQMVRQGMLLAAGGIAAGIAGAWVLTRFLASLLFGVRPTDPITFALVPVVTVVAALLACFLPARRAAKVDPMVALRYE
ncbi:MAG: ABC transporter permease [Terriglobia bacterium]